MKNLVARLILILSLCKFKEADPTYRCMKATHLKSGRAKLQNIKHTPFPPSSFIGSIWQVTISTPAAKLPGLTNGCCCCCQIVSVVSDSVRPHRRQPTRLCRPWDSPGKNTGVGCHFLHQCMKVKRESEVTDLCPTLSDPMDCSLPGSSIHGSFQARVQWLSPNISYVDWLY